MKVVVLRSPNDVAIVEAAEPDGHGRAVVSLEQLGICGTDVKIFHGDIPVAYPRVLGHELVGRVEQPGPRGVLPLGTRVLIDPAVSCGYCPLCRSDRANLCPNGALLGRDLDGGFAQRIAVDELQLHAVPENISHRAASLLQVLGTCVHAQSQVDVRGIDTAVVVGLGVAGLLHLQLLRARGIRRIMGVARSAGKRELALSFGASVVAEPDEAEQAVRDLTGGTGAALVVEAVGSVPTLSLAVRLASLAGTILVFGTITDPTARDVPFYQLYYKELQILNPRAAVPRDYDRAIAMAESGDVVLEPLWARSYPLAQAAEAFSQLSGASGGPLKITLDVP